MNHLGFHPLFICPYDIETEIPEEAIGTFEGIDANVLLTLGVETTILTFRTEDFDNYIRTLTWQESAFAGSGVGILKFKANGHTISEQYKEHSTDVTPSSATYPCFVKCPNNSLIEVTYTNNTDGAVNRTLQIFFLTGFKLPKATGGF